MDEKEITNATTMLTVQFFVAFNKMKELTGDDEEALKLANSLFAAIFKENEQQSRNDNFILYWDRRGQEK